MAKYGIRGPKRALLALGIAIAALGVALAVLGPLLAPRPDYAFADRFGADRWAERGFGQGRSFHMDSREALPGRGPLPMGHGFGFPLAGIALVAAGGAAIGIWFARRKKADASPVKEPSAEERLRLDFAEGRIDEKEYLSRVETLRS
jgi:hypothetical protein